MKHHLLTSPEVELVAQLKLGNQRAVQQWFHCFQGRLLRLALSKVSDREAAQELVQETFINCLKSLPLFRGQSSLWTWMQSILRHEVADYYRKKYAKKAIRVLPLSEVLFRESISDAHETSLKVQQVLIKMVSVRRELLFAKYVDKKKVKQIALELGRTVKSVESELFRARLEFRQLYLLLDSG